GGVDQADQQSTVYQTLAVDGSGRELLVGVQRVVVVDEVGELGDHGVVHCPGELHQVADIRERLHVHHLPGSEWMSLSSLAIVAGFCRLCAESHSVSSPS